MKKFWEEFKAFAFKGNLIELAIAVVIGGAFGKVVTSFTSDVLVPLLAYAGSGKADAFRDWHNGDIKYGLFLGALVDFLIQALVIFIVLVKVTGMVVKKKESAPTTRDCPMCLSAIPLAAKKCKFCTADLPN